VKTSSNYASSIPKLDRKFFCSEKRTLSANPKFDKSQTKEGKIKAHTYSKKSQSSYSGKTETHTEASKTKQ